MNGYLLAFLLISGSLGAMEWTGEEPDPYGYPVRGKMVNGVFYPYPPVQTLWDEWGNSFTVIVSNPVYPLFPPKYYEEQQYDEDAYYPKEVKVARKATKTKKVRNTNK